jgi:hypothetical protein
MKANLKMDTLFSSVSSVVSKMMTPSKKGCLSAVGNSPLLLDYLYIERAITNSAKTIIFDIFVPSHTLTYG